MHYTLLSPTTPELTLQQTLDICRLKMSHWRYPLNSQIEWLRERAGSSDKHMLAYQGNNLIAYARMIVRRPAYIDGVERVVAGLSTIVVAPEQRGRGVGMDFVRRCTMLLDGCALLQCSARHRSFYERCGWKVFDGEVWCVKDGRELAFLTDDLVMISGENPNWLSVQGDSF